jgi:hypothetical protein
MSLYWLWWIFYHLSPNDPNQVDGVKPGAGW